MDRLALVYATDAYHLPPPGGPRLPSGQGILKGRQVAGKEFLDALFRFGRWRELVGIALSEADQLALEQTWRDSPAVITAGRQLRVVPLARLHRDFLAAPTAPVLHFPNPPHVKYAWARRHVAPHTLSLTGVTHTICSATIAAVINDYVTAPLEEYDALICTSQAAAAVIRTLAAAYADYLADRFGGTFRLRLRLETIPLGVDSQRYRPAGPDERAAARRLFGVTADEIAVLYVGRLSPHSKAHPYPMYRALAAACRQTGRKANLLMCGQAAGPAIAEMFHAGARDFAPGLRVTFIDGAHPTHPQQAWRGADLFTSLSDSLQETFGLALVEAQACGLPAVAADWDGYRDIVADGETGYLVPTFLVRDATRHATTRLLTGETTYDGFLGECNQTTVVDESAAREAYARLLTDEALRARMSEAARRRAAENFSWARMIAAYEALWDSLDACRRKAARTAAAPRGATPECYPPPEVSFAAYPTAVLGDDTPLRLNPERLAGLASLLHHELTSYWTAERATDLGMIQQALAGEGALSVGEVARRLAAQGAQPTPARATVAWLMKYGVLERVG